MSKIMRKSGKVQIAPWCREKRVQNKKMQGKRKSFHMQKLVRMNKS
jgi:hypothetical protein